jgi:dihydroorotase
MPADLVEKMSLMPNRILGLDGGTLSAGKPADITVVDPKAKWKVDSSLFYSKARNTAFEGMELKGFARYTILGGAIVYLRK